MSDHDGDTGQLVPEGDLRRIVREEVQTALRDVPTLVSIEVARALVPHDKRISKVEQDLDEAVSSVSGLVKLFEGLGQKVDAMSHQITAVVGTLSNWHGVVESQRESARYLRAKIDQQDRDIDLLTSSQANLSGDIKHIQSALFGMQGQTGPPAIYQVLSESDKRLVRMEQIMAYLGWIERQRAQRREMMVKMASRVIEHPLGKIAILLAGSLVGLLGYISLS